MVAVGTVGLSGAARAAGGPAYNPAARFDLAVSEVELRRNSAGRMLMARIYQPKGPGPFPTVLDLHGGAWNRKDRFAEEPMDRALAASGLLVAAVDLTLAPEAPYPACVQDATVAWVALRSPISNTFARYENAKRRHNEGMVKNNKVFFSPWQTIHESNPQELLEREEKVTLVPLLIMQGAL